MNHFLRDRITGGKDSVGKFGDASTTHLITEMFRSDRDPGHYEARLFGGGAVVGHLGMGIQIGKGNIAVAKEVLARAGIPVVEEDTGGRQGRKIYFNTRDARVDIHMIGVERKDYSGRNVRVLIVDDSPLVRQILRDVVSASPGFEVCGEAGDAFEARDRVLELDPDVISLDIIMPKLDGLDFLERLMKYKPMPVVIVSTIAKTDSAIAARAKKLGAVCTIDKDALEIYKGMDNARRVYIPALKTAAMSVL